MCLLCLVAACFRFLFLLHYTNLASCVICLPFLKRSVYTKRIPSHRVSISSYLLACIPLRGLILLFFNSQLAYFASCVICLLFFKRNVYSKRSREHVWACVRVSSSFFLGLHRDPNLGEGSWLLPSWRGFCFAVTEVRRGGFLVFFLYSSSLRFSYIFF